MTWVRRDYTDVMVVVGRTHEDAKRYYFDLRRNRPEVVLGYSIKLVSLGEVWQRQLEGMRVRDYVFTPYSFDHADRWSAEDMLQRSMVFGGHWRTPRSI